MKKIPVQFTDEELLSLTSSDKKADKLTSDQQFLQENEIVLFLSQFNILPGSNRIQKKFLYNLYKSYIIEVKYTPIEFNLRVRDFIPVDATCFLVNKSAQELASLTFRKEFNRKYNRPDYIHFDGVRKHIESFFAKHEIKAPVDKPVKIPAYALYYLYDVWCYDGKRKNKLGYISFLNIIKTYFHHVRKGSDKAAMMVIDSSIYNHITKEEIGEVEEGIIRRYGKPEKPQTRSLEEIYEDIVKRYEDKKRKRQMARSKSKSKSKDKKRINSGR